MSINVTLCCTQSWSLTGSGQQIIRYLVHKLCHRIQRECAGGLAAGQRHVPAHHQGNRQVCWAPGGREKGAARRPHTLGLAEYGEVGELWAGGGGGSRQRPQWCWHRTVFTNLEKINSVRNLETSISYAIRRKNTLETDTRNVKNSCQCKILLKYFSISDIVILVLH